MKIGTLLLRTTIGGFFVGHGAQKLFGAFDGGGLKGTAKHFEGLGLRPGIAQATAAGLAETGGGLGLVLGYRTPLAASAIVATMTTAIQRVHGKNGWNITAGGFEYNAVLIAGAVALAEAGPGPLSLDALRGKQHEGILWGAFALGAGVAGATAAQALADRFSGPEPLAGETVQPAPATAPATVEEAVAEPAGEALPVDPLPDATAAVEPLADDPPIGSDA